MHGVGWINFKTVKSRPVQDQKNIFTYSLAKLIADYLKPLAAWKCPYSELFWSVFSRIRTRIIPNRDTFYAVPYSN